MDGDNLLSKGLLDSLADLEAPKLPKYSEGEAYLTKILKDKQRLKKANEKRERQEEAFRQRNAEDSDGADDAEEAAAKKARFEESKADLQKKIRAQAGPPAFKQAMFPSQSSSVEAMLSLSAEADVSSSCSDVVDSDLDRSTLMRELLIGGWLYQHYTKQGSIPIELQQQLFVLASQSSDIEVACKAYDILAAVFEASLKESPKKYSGLYRQSKVRPAACHLTDADFTQSLSVLGVCTPESSQGQKSRKQPSKDGTKPDSEDKAAGSEQSGLPGWADASMPPKFLNLQLLLRLLTTISKLQAAGKCDVMTGAGTGQLLLTVLSLQLDPACNLLGLDLEAAAESLIEAIPASDWSRKFHDLASQVAGLGSSHRGAVEVVRLLGGQGVRAQTLRTHAIAHLLPTLLLTKGAQAAKPSKSRGEPQALHPEPLVAAQPWFEDGMGYNRLAKNARLGNVNIWELRSVIELVDILLWPYVKASKESGEELSCKEFVAKWHLFCQKLGNHMNKDNEGAALKLLITTIITRNNPSCV